MRHAVELAPAAMRQLKKLPLEVRRRIYQSMEGLQTNPKPHGSIKLEVSSHLYRMRVGDYRVVYRVTDRQLLVLILKIGHREGVYRGGRGL